MIGHFLLTLTSEQEDRALTRTMKPWPRSDVFDAGPCLIQTTSCGVLGGLKYWDTGERGFHAHGVGPRYDALCHRFGSLRINGLIRNRIWSNRARRVLQSVEAAHV